MVGRCTSYAAGRDLTSGLWKFERSAPSRTCSSLVASGLSQNTKQLLIATSWPPPRSGHFFGKQSKWYSVLSIILLSPFCCCCKTAAQDKDLNEEPSNSKVSCCVMVFVISLSHPLIFPCHFISQQVQCMPVYQKTVLVLQAVMMIVVVEQQQCGRKKVGFCCCTVCWMHAPTLPLTLSPISFLCRCND